MNANPPLSIILTTHREGPLAEASISALTESVQRAAENNFSAEIIVVLDRPDDETRKTISSRAGLFSRTIETDHGDPGLARNEGISESKGEAILVMDADNLISPNWITQAMKCWKAHRGERIIWHPERNLYFGEELFLTANIDQSTDDFDARSMFDRNPWDTLCIADRETFLNCPYEPTYPDDGFGFEDWHWNCETVSRGYIHRKVPGTTHFIRKKKSGSVSQKSRELGAVPRPSRLFVELAKSTSIETRQNLLVHSRPLRHALQDSQFRSDLEFISKWVTELTPDTRLVERLRWTPDQTTGEGWLYVYLLSLLLNCSGRVAVYAGGADQNCKIGFRDQLFNENTPGWTIINWGSPHDLYGLTTPEGTSVLELGHYTVGINAEGKERLLLRLLLQLGPKVLIGAGSYWKFFVERYRAPLSCYAQLSKTFRFEDFTSLPDSIVHPANLSLKETDGIFEAYIDDVEKRADSLSLRGWAVEVASALPAYAILAMVDDQIVSAGYPSDARDDVVHKFKRSSVRRCGFSISLATKYLRGETLAVLAVSSSGMASTFHRQQIDSDPFLNSGLCEQSRPSSEATENFCSLPSGGP